MTDATVLADALVEAGMGEYHIRAGSDRHYHVSFGSIGLSAEQFITDWRVAGKVLESMNEEVLIWRINYEDEDLEGGELVSLQTGHAWVVEPEKLSAATQNESLPRAIIEAWYEARR